MSEFHTSKEMREYIKHNSGVSFIPKYNFVRFIDVSHGKSYICKEIGYGHVLYVSDIVPRVELHNDNIEWTLNKVEDMFNQDIDKCESCINTLFENVALTQDQFDALVSYRFDQLEMNIAGTGLLQVLGKFNKSATNDIYNIFSDVANTTSLNTYRKDRTSAEQRLFEIGDCQRITTDEYGGRGAMIVQTMLNELYQPILQGLSQYSEGHINIDGINGKKTKAAITVMLQLYLNELGAGIEVDGIMSHKIYDFMKNNNLLVARGEHSDLVRIVQYILTANGYASALIRDKKDLATTPSTLTAVWCGLLQGYKKDHKLSIDIPFAAWDFFYYALS